MMSMPKEWAKLPVISSRDLYESILVEDLGVLLGSQSATANPGNDESISGDLPSPNGWHRRLTRSYT